MEQPVSVKRFDIMCVGGDGMGGGEVPHHSNIRPGWRSQSVKKCNMMWGERFHTAVTSDLDGGASLE